MFDADTFLSGTVEGEMSTDFVPIPEGEYAAFIKGVAARSTSSDKGEYVILDVTWAVDDGEVAKTVGIDNPTVRQSIFLDVTENGGLDLSKGKNIQLGRLRDAVGQNDGGPWAPSMLEGQVGRIRVAHRIYEDRIFAEVKGVAAAA